MKAAAKDTLPMTTPTLLPTTSAAKEVHQMADRHAVTYKETRCKVVLPLWQSESSSTCVSSSGTVCKSCGKKGHLDAVCRSKPHTSTPATSTPTKYVEDGSDSEAEAPVLTLSSPRTPPIRVCVNLVGQEVMMEVDTGAAVSLMSAEQ